MDAGLSAQRAYPSFNSAQPIKSPRCEGERIRSSCKNIPPLRWLRYLRKKPKAAWKLCCAKGLVGCCRRQRLAEEVRSLILALRGELANMREQMDARLTHVEAKLEKHDDHFNTMLASQKTILEKLEKQERTPALHHRPLRKGDPP